MTTTGQKRPWRSKFLKWKQVGLEAETEVDVVPRQFLHFPKVSMMSARFPVAENRVLQLLPAGKFELAVRNAGTAELFLAAMQYHEVDGMAAFNQVCIGTLVRPLSVDPARERRGYFYFYAPVTTPQACAMGEQDYGFPTFLADIAFEETAVSFSCHLSADNTPILSLCLKKRETEPDMWAYTNLTNHRGQLRQSYFQARGESVVSDRSGRVHCELGTHVLSEWLGELRLGSISLNHRYAVNVEALLHTPRAV